MLSNGAATAYVDRRKLEIKNWFNHGIGTPGGMNGDIYHHLTVRNVTIKDVDNAGVNLSSWLERPSNGRKGLRGGDHLTFTDNVIDGANSFGITGYFAASTFEGNTLKNIALGRPPRVGDPTTRRSRPTRSAGFASAARTTRKAALPRPPTPPIARAIASVLPCTESKTMSAFTALPISAGMPRRGRRPRR